MRQDPRLDRRRDSGRRTVRVAAPLALLAVAIVGCVFIDSVVDGPDTPPPSGPTATASDAAPTSRPSSPSIPTASVAPPRSTEPGHVGDYRCLTLVDATAAIERDGFAVGSVSHSIEGGAVDGTWLVDVQDPPPGPLAAPGTEVDLLLASPFNVCRSTGLRP